MYVSEGLSEKLSCAIRNSILSEFHVDYFVKIIKLQMGT